MELMVGRAAHSSLFILNSGRVTSVRKNLFNTRQIKTRCIQYGYKAVVAHLVKVVLQEQPDEPFSLSIA
jgi:hypothetical protein